jgi:hypothetical protein
VVAVVGGEREALADVDGAVEAAASCAVLFALGAAEARIRTETDGARGQYDVRAIFAALPASALADELPLAEADANTPGPTSKPLMASSVAANCRRDLAVIFDLL